MKKLLFAGSLLILIIFVISCAPSEPLTDEELKSELAKLTPEERQQLISDLEGQESGALAGQAIRAKPYARKISTRTFSVPKERITKAVEEVQKENVSLKPAPEVFNTKFYQSPVRADPDDLLLIPGYGFKEGVVVVYKSVSDKPADPELQPPSAVPNSNTPTEGKLYVARVDQDSVAVLLPKEMKNKQTYALFVKNKDSKWSEPVLINDPRPLWVTPDKAYSTQSFASLPREIKVVGRNLEGLSPVAGSQIRLVGSPRQIYYLNVQDDNDPSTSIEDYAARAELPASMQPGEYKVEFSRDGTNWIEVPENKFTVLADQQPKQKFDLSTYGSEKNGVCSGTDDNDDTGCIVSAIAAAKQAGGGEVFIPAGTWLLKDPIKSGDNSWHANGIVVPQGVDLVGTGAEGNNPSKITQTLDWKRDYGNGDIRNVNTVFSLMGNNKIEGIYFHSDGFIPHPTTPNHAAGGVLIYMSLGKSIPLQNEPKDIPVENVIITNNIFSGLNDGKVKGMYYIIGPWLRPTDHFFLVNNKFQAFKDALTLYLGNTQAYFDSGYYAYKFTLRDSVISKNTFYPGDYTKKDQGTIASEMSGAQRVDFSDNFADGSTQGGWRATFFWSLHQNNGPMLLSNNKATHTGKKSGDGEAFVTDNNGNNVGFEWPEKVASATSNTVTVNGKWAKTWYKGGNWVEVPEHFFDDSWVVIADGKGVGQVRRIVSYNYNAPQTFTVTPAWDVVPDSSSKITIKRNTWNAFIVDNLVDNTQTFKKSGTLGFAGMTSDSVIAGNKLYDSTGLYLSASGQEGTWWNNKENPYFAGWHIFATEVRNNLVDGESQCLFADHDLTLEPTPQNTAGCIVGGIHLWYGSPEDKPTVVTGHNVLISHNKINRADDLGGSITSRPSHTRSKITPYQIKNVLVFNNDVEESPTYGVGVWESYVWNTVLYGNKFKNNKKDDIYDQGTNTVQI